ncbi:helicase associated domain-containing protein [uncultured Robinsoniella sp.]|uniref:helicase associated domain-containing protein n=1 Tax=uncultured Robinsoniella sp. TaxID=904190 RepID=UPI00374FCD04
MNITGKRQYTRLEWDVWYELAKIYFEKNHNLRIPAKYKSEQGYLLGRWIERQRAAYHEKGVYKIDNRKIYLLNRIGMEWTLGIRTQWEIWYQYCFKYYEKYKHIDIPRDYIVKHLPLGEWISYQRKRYKQNKLSIEEIAKLECLGINWQMRVRREWDEWYEQASCYYQMYGDLEVPLNYITESGCKLGIWINVQREKYRGTRKNNLEEYEINKLNQIGMLWGVRSKRNTEKILLEKSS